MEFSLQLGDFPKVVESSPNVISFYQKSTSTYQPPLQPCSGLMVPSLKVDKTESSISTYTEEGQDDKTP